MDKDIESKIHKLQRDMWCHWWGILVLAFCLLCLSVVFLLYIQAMKLWTKQIYAKLSNDVSQHLYDRTEDLTKELLHDYMKLVKENESNCTTNLDEDLTKELLTEYVKLVKENEKDHLNYLTVMNNIKNGRPKQNIKRNKTKKRKEPTELPPKTNAVDVTNTENK